MNREDPAAVTWCLVGSYGDLVLIVSHFDLNNEDAVDDRC